jgi:hypothetical protein
VAHVPLPRGLSGLPACFQTTDLVFWAALLRFFRWARHEKRRATLLLYVGLARLEIPVAALQNTSARVRKQAVKNTTANAHAAVVRYVSIRHVGPLKHLACQRCLLVLDARETRLIHGYPRAQHVDCLGFRTVELAELDSGRCPEVLLLDTCSSRASPACAWPLCRRK